MTRFTYDYKISRFSRLVRLFLEPNDRLISDDFVWQIRGDSGSDVMFKEKSPRRCHYMHRVVRNDQVEGDDGVTAAFTYCPGSSKVSRTPEVGRAIVRGGDIRGHSLPRNFSNFFDIPKNCEKCGKFNGRFRLILEESLTLGSI